MIDDAVKPRCEFRPRLIRAGGPANAEKRLLRDVDRIFEQIRLSLVEGGLFLSSFPAVSRLAGPYEMPLGEGEDVAAPHRFHEIELQYRLRRAGFQGVRIRRFAECEERPESLLALAVRRANN